MSKRERYVKRYNITKFYDWNGLNQSKFRSLNTSFVNWLHKMAPNASLALKSFNYALALVVISACSVGTSDKTDPVVVEQPVAFIKRPLTNADGEILENDLTDPTQFRPGAVLYLKESATPNASSKDISSSAFSDPSFLNDDGQLLYDVKDLHVSFDGTKLLFSMRAPEIEDADEEDQPKWNIWEYDITNASLRRVIESDLSAEEGHDISPIYLPNGRILFSSTRQRRSKAILLDEGGEKTQFSGLEETRNTEAFVLHTITAESGDDIQQLTFNQSHDLYPLLMDNGKILFSRWDNAGQTRSNGYNLYEINTDGSGLNYIYGRHSHDSGSQGSQVQFSYPRQLENGNIAVQLREFQNENLSSQPTEINIKDYVEHDVRIDGTVVDLSAQTGGQTAIISGLTTSETQTLKGSYSAFFPLNDGTNRYLVSWSVCRVQLIDSNSQMAGNQTGPVEFCTQAKLDATEDYEAADPLYGLWIYNANNDTQLPIDLSESGFVFDEAMLVKSRSTPFIPESEVLGSQEQVLASSGFGVIHIKSVYDFDGVDTSGVGIDVLSDPAQTPAEDRPQRFIRIEKPASIPSDEVRDFDNTAYGRSRAQLMREIVGYAPIEPDGSVKVAVPANIAFAISVLNEDGKRTSQRHQNWLQVAPGETVECIGCHTANSQVPHGRVDAQPESINPGAPTTGLPFPNTDPALFADMGETMAETYSRINGIRRLSSDIVFDDEWTDPLASPSASFSYAYTDLETTSPMLLPGCATDWSSVCRSVVNYETIIHPLWSVDRQLFDTDEVTLLEDRTCIACHTNTDDADDLMVPVAQLDLSDGPSTDEADHFKAYRELLFNDNELELVGGVLVERLVETGEFNQVPVLDGDGQIVFDENGDQVFIDVPITEPVPVLATMSVNGALASARFMSLFEAGGVHENYLSKAELKLISEWLDMGAQYFNNPFAAPAN